MRLLRFARNDIRSARNVVPAQVNVSPPSVTEGIFLKTGAHVSYISRFLRPAARISGKLHGIILSQLVLACPGGSGVFSQPTKTTQERHQEGFATAGGVPGLSRAKKGSP
jgi:hypothetical protein